MRKKLINHAKTRLWDLSKMLLRFRDPAKLFQDPHFSRYHSPPLHLYMLKVSWMQNSSSFQWAVYKSGTGTSGRVCGDLGLGDARRGTWGHQVWDAWTCGTGTRGRQIKGRRGRGMWMIFTYIFSGKPNSKCLLTVLKGWFPLTRFWLCTLTQVNFNHVNKIEAKYKLLRLNVKLCEILLLRLRV